MKKAMLYLCMAVLAVLLAVSVFAEETVIYENDFSDPSTLSDFEQYRMTWEIRDGGLYLTDKVEAGIDKPALADCFAHIIYQAKEPLTDYIVEVDYMNVQTSGGVIFNAQQDEVTTDLDGFRGYVAYVSNKADLAALGNASDKDSWKGSLASGGNGISIGSNMHIKVTVKDKKILFEMSDIDTGKKVYETEYKIGSKASADQNWTSGTAGLRIRAAYTPNKVSSVGTAYFDNFRITTANEVGAAAKPATPATPAPVTTTGEIIDTSNLVEVYRNEFESDADLADFTQYRGNWMTFGGRLYLTSMQSNFAQAFLVYTADKALTEMTDYVVDVDVYNVQTQGGLIGRADSSKIDGKSDDGIYGYFGYFSFTGEKPVIGYGTAAGKWGGNVEVGPACVKPGMNVHLQFAFKGDTVQLTVTDLDSGAQLWQHAENASIWNKGTFGFRVYGKMRDGLDNINGVSYDNFVISTFGEAKEKTEVKLTIGKMEGYVNGVAKALDAAPVIRNSRTMLPVRFVAENLGATVGWDGATSTVTVTTATTKLEIKIGATTAKINGAEVTLDSPAFIENSRTYLPVRFVAENLGAAVEWDGTTSTATLTK